MAAAKKVLLIALGQLLQGKIARGVEQTQPSLLSLSGNHRFRTELPNAIRYICFIHRLIGDNGDRRFECKSAGKNAESAQDTLLGLAEQVVAPLQCGV